MINGYLSTVNGYEARIYGYVWWRLILPYRPRPLYEAPPSGERAEPELED